MTCKTILLAIISMSFTALAGDIVELRPEIQESAKRNGIDPALLEAIIRHETGNGKSRAARVYNNLGGVMKGRKLRKFNTQSESVECIAQILSRYHNRGLVSIDEIGRRYAPYHRREWTNAVRYFKSKIEGGEI